MSKPAQIVTVTTASVSYEVHIGTGLLASLDSYVAQLTNSAPKIFVVTSPEIWSLWAESFLSSFAILPTILMIPAGEQHKRLGTLERLAEEMAEARADRDSV